MAATKRGTTFLIEGAPGAGKSALLAECGDLAEQSGWLVPGGIPVKSLHDTDEMRRVVDGVRKLKFLRGNLGGWGLGWAGGSTISSPHHVLGKGKKPLLLVLDEAQRLHALAASLPGSDARLAMDVLDRIHNGVLARPVLLLAGGLGTTADAFAKLGISRFDDDHEHALGALGPDAERAVLHDWLTIDAKAQGNPQVWIDAIVPDTHGWPHHIIAYVKPALKQISADNGQMTLDGLTLVLESGRERCRKYYRRRTQGFSSRQLRALVRSFPSGQPGAQVTDDAIMKSLEAAMSQQGEAERLFDRAMEKGVLSQHDDQIVIPIPSMHAWLERKYGAR